MNEAAFHLEVLKLVIQVAWADDELDAREVELLVDLGRAWKVPEPELEKLAWALERKHEIAPPNLGLLRENAEEAMDVARDMVMADHKLELSEVDVLGTIAELLNIKGK